MTDRPAMAAARRAQDAHQDWLSSLANVVGVGVTPVQDDSDAAAPTDADQPMAVAVYVSKKQPLDQLSDDQVVPSVLVVDDGDHSLEVPTRVIEVGEISFGLSGDQML